MGITAKIIKKGNSFERIRKNVSDLDGEDVSIGYFQEQGNHPSGLSYPSLMSIQEFGTENIPSRPIFQIVGFKKDISKDPEVNSAIRAWSKSLQKKAMAGRLLDSIGKSYQVALSDMFGDSSQLTPNHPTTIRIKGRDEPLVDSGDLKSNLSYRNSIDGGIKK